MKTLSLILFLIIAAQCSEAANFVIVKDKGMTAKEIQKIESAAKKVSDVVASQCFVDWMIKQKMNNTNGRTPREVIDHLRTLNDDVQVKMYFRCMRRGFRCPIPTSAVAYRQPPEKAINMNRAAFTLSTPTCRWASTFAHEALGHALGNYGHSMEWSRFREDTVPYLLSGRKKHFGGDVFDACCRE